MGQCCLSFPSSNMRTTLILVSLVPVLKAGLLGAGEGHGSCAAFPNRGQLLDHVGGCPRWAECCTEFGYCHGRENWEKGYFRDCNGQSNGQPLPGTVIRLEAAEAAKGDSKVDAEFLGISQELWQNQITTSGSFSSETVSTSSSSGTLSDSISNTLSTSSSFPPQQPPSTSGLSSSDLIAQILLALRPQISSAVQQALPQTSSTSFNQNVQTGSNDNGQSSTSLGSNSITFPSNNPSGNTIGVGNNGNSILSSSFSSGNNDVPATGFSSGNTFGVGNNDNSFLSSSFSSGNNDIPATGFGSGNTLGVGSNGNSFLSSSFSSVNNDIPSTGFSSGNTFSSVSNNVPGNTISNFVATRPVPTNVFSVTSGNINTSSGSGLDIDELVQLVTAALGQEVLNAVNSENSV